MNDHPGGAEIMVNSSGAFHPAAAGPLLRAPRAALTRPPHPSTPSPVAGKDATEAFTDVGHSGAAKKMLEKYQVGVLSAEDAAKVAAARETAAKSGAGAAPIVVAVLVLAAALVWQFFLR